jgi:hypothetical protein
MNFVLLLEATANTLGVTPANLLQIASAITVQLNRDVAPAWGGTHLVRVSDPGAILPGEIAFAILDNLPDAPGAVAYHDVEGNGVPVAFAALAMCNAILTGSDSLSVAISHECCEAVGNPAVNEWVDDGFGNEWCHELCDAVEAVTYSVDGVDVSDFVLPSFFDHGATGPYSHQAATGMPFATAPGGYQIQRTSGTNEHQSALESRAPRALYHGPSGRPLHEAHRRHLATRAGRILAQPR